MPDNQKDKLKILYVVTTLLRALLGRKGRAMVLIYDEPCPVHDVYNICIGPAPEMVLSLNMGRMFQRLFAWAAKYDEEHTFVNAVRTEITGTRIRMSFLGVALQIQISYITETMEVDLNAYGSAFTYNNGHLKMVTAETKSLKPKKKYSVSEPPQEATAIFQTESEVEPPDQSGFPASPDEDIRARPEQVSAMLFVFITLLGGTATIKEMESLSSAAKVTAYKYLRTFYGNKFCNGKEKTGRRPSFLSGYLTPKKG